MIFRGGNELLLNRSYPYYVSRMITRLRRGESISLQLRIPLVREVEILRRLYNGSKARFLLLFYPVWRSGKYAPRLSYVIARYIIAIVIVDR